MTARATVSAGRGDHCTSPGCQEGGRPTIGRMRDAVICAAVRTPVGKRGGALSGVHAVDLSAHVLGALAERTGSRAFERFTGPQIRKFFKRQPDAYAATDRVHLVSSFLASLLAGRHAPIDPGDGSGMNLMELASATWWPPVDRKSTRLNSSHIQKSRMPSSA